MDKKFIVTAKEERSTNLTIRINTEYFKRLDEISAVSGRSRNEIINMAIKFALDNLEFVDGKKN